MSEDIGAGVPGASEITESPETEESSEEGSEESSSQIKSQTPTKQEKKFLKSLKIKFDGKEFDEELPFEIPDDEKSVEYMRKQLQMSRLAQAKSRESADKDKRLSQMEADARQIIEFARANPRAFIREMGHNDQELAEQILQEAIEESKKSPEQQELDKIRAELEKERGEKEKILKDREEQQKLEMVKKFESDYETEMLSSLDGLGFQVDRNTAGFMIDRCAHYLSQAIEAGYDYSVKDVMPMVVNETKTLLKQLVKVMPDEALEEFLSKDRLSVYRKNSIAKAKQTVAPAKKVFTQAVEPKKEPISKGNSKELLKDWLRG